jgi:hypothetical protein
LAAVIADHDANQKRVKPEPEAEPEAVRTRSDQRLKGLQEVQQTNLPLEVGIGVGESSTKDQKKPIEEAIREADETLAGLCGALASHGITPPSIWVEPWILTGLEYIPLITLGRINVETARKLTAALERGTACSPEQ